MKFPRATRQNCQSVDFVPRGWCRSTSGHLLLKLMSDAVRRSKFPCGVGTYAWLEEHAKLIVLVRLVSLVAHLDRLPAVGVRSNPEASKVRSERATSRGNRNA